MDIYLDTCALNRLTDDQSHTRIRDEAQAVARSLDHVTSAHLLWIASDLFREELSVNPHIGSRNISLAFLNLASTFVTTGLEARQRARSLQDEGFGAHDVLHLALAEQAGAAYLFTVDDRLLNRSATLTASIEPTVLNPLEWVHRRHLWLLKS